MRASLRWFLVSVALALAGALSAGCNVTDPLFCCTTAEACQAAGQTAMYPCTDPARPFCDNTGEYADSDGVPRTCIPDPLATDCNGPEDCTTAERPFCVDNVCVACEASGDCAATAPVCDTDTHMCGACLIDDECADRVGEPRCFVDDGACVACLEALDCSDITAPICDDTGHSCRGCVADAECASEVCADDVGSCANAADVIYVAMGGVGSGPCSQAAPCSTIALGLGQVTGPRNVIKVRPGTYSGQVVLDNIAVTITGDGATIQPGALGQSVVVISNGANVAIEGPTITNAGGGGNPVGVSCSPGAGASPTLVLKQTTIKGNAGGGVSITSCQFTLVNNVIALNGSPTSTLGGVAISQISTGSPHQFEFNTITANTGIAGANTGVDCANVFIPLTLANSILYGNTVAGGAQVGGDVDCSTTYSDIGPITVAGTGNINMAPLFVDAGNGDFHLQPTSPGRDVADPGASLAVDIDGDTRPQGAGRDMGADETVP